MSSSAQWMHNLQALGAVCRPVTVDLWGHGDSPAPDDSACYLPEGYGAALEALREELGADQWLMCGYSLGAGITLRYAHTHPDRVPAQIFTNSASGLADAGLAAEWASGAEASAARILKDGVAAMERIPVHPRYARNLPRDIYEALLADAARLSPTGIAQLLRHTTPNASIRDIAPHNRTATLLCHGKREKRFAASKEWAAANMANLEIVDLDAGHAVNMEDSAGFNAAACEFIARHTP